MIFKTIYLPNNQGHGNARRVSLENCSYDLVALMDSDDISLPFRFEKQLDKFASDPELQIVGGQITEFIGSPENIIGKRKVPEQDADIKKYMKKRCPMNQVSVMLRKGFVQRVGGYLDWYCEEDYYLWIRMALANGKFANVPDTLVNVRIGDEMSARRGGWKYFSSEARLQKYMLRKKIIAFPRYLYNVAIRFGGEVIVPDKMRTGLFKLLRPSVKKKKKQAENVLNANKKCKNIVKRYPPFSVAMCVYAGDNAEWFDTALESVTEQTVQPDEITLVVDGPIPDAIKNVIEKYQKICGS